MAKTPRVPGDTSDLVADAPAAPETLSDLAELVALQVEHIATLRDMYADLSEEVADLRSRVGNAAPQQAAVVAEQQARPTLLPTQEEALERANAIGRAVESRDGWVAPTIQPKPPAIAQR